ncbi:MAG: hypothetical protein ACOC13_00845 [Tangfeifania sp.]
MKLVFTIFCLIILLGATAQEPLMPVLSEQDSTELNAEPDVLYRQFPVGISPPGELMQPLNMPELNFDDALFNYKNLRLADYSFGNWYLNDFYPGYSGISPAPFLPNGTIFSQGSYQLNDKFRVGGYSFGGNSIFSAPFPNQNTGNFDFRGSTLFMEYKISDKFKIETRVSVSQGR